MSAKRKAEGGRQEDGKCPLRLRSKDSSQRVSERNQKGADGGKVTKRKRVATTLDDKDNVDQRKDNPYETRAFVCQWYAESGMIAEHVREVSRETRG